MALMEGVAYGLGDNSVNFWSCGLRLGHLAAEIPRHEAVYRAGTRAPDGAIARDMARGFAPPRT